MMKKLALNLLKSADEKLRSLGGKHHGNPKSSINVVPQQAPHTTSSLGRHQGRPPDFIPIQSQKSVSQEHLSSPQHTVQQKSTGASSGLHHKASRSQPPREPPPAPPVRVQVKKVPCQVEVITAGDNDEIEEDEELEDTNMSERRIQRLGRRDVGSGKIQQQNVLPASRAAEIKRRSRSEGPASRLKPRNSMDEKKIYEGRDKSTKTGQYKVKQQRTRHSMYTEPLSDDGGFPDIQGSSTSASDSDEANRKKWVKNPLIVKRMKKSDKRKSLNTDGTGKENYNTEIIQVRTTNKNPQTINRDHYITQDRNGNNSQKGKYQKLEERRRKRVDITVTSDEELNSPELRISKLRQRALQGTKMATKLPDRLEDAQRMSHTQMIGHVAPEMMYQQNKPQDQPEHESSSSEQITLRQIGPGHNMAQERYHQIEVENNNFNQPRFDNARNNNANISLKDSYHGYMPQNRDGKYFLTGQGSYKKIPKQETNYLHQPETSVSHNTIEMPKQPSLQRSESYGSRDASDKNKDQRQVGGVIKYSKAINEFSSNPNYQPDWAKQQKKGGSDTEMSFTEVKTNRPMVLKKAIDLVDRKRKSYSEDDDSLDELIESNIQYLESEIESGKLQKMPVSKPAMFPVNKQEVKQNTSVNVAKRKSASLDNVARPVQSSFQNEVKLRLQIPSSSTSAPRQVLYSKQSDSAAGYDPYVNRSDYIPVSVSNFPVTTVPSSVRTNMYNLYQNTVPNRRHQSATHSPYMQRRSTELTDMEDLSKSDSQLNSADFAPRYGIAYGIQNQPHKSQMCHGFSAQGLAHYDNVNIPKENHTNLKSLSVPVLEQGMFSDVEYDIEVSERVKKWEKLMKKKFTQPSSDGSKDPVSLTTILENEGGIPDSWIHGPVQDSIYAPPSRAVSSISVTVTKSTSHVDPPMKKEPVRQLIKPSIDDPKVVTTETSSHRIFRLVQQPGSAALTKTTDSSMTYDGNSNKMSLVYHERPVSTYADESKTRKDEEKFECNTNNSNTSLKQAWPPRRNKPQTEEQKQARLSKYEEELSELQELKQDSVKDLRRKFDSEGSGNESTDVAEELSSACRTPLRQRKQFTKIVYHVPETKQIEEKSVIHSRRRDSGTYSDKSNVVSDISSPLTEADVWSPNLESSKGLVSIERVKARTLQTIPFSEDPIWKQIEEMTSFDQLMQSGNPLEVVPNLRPGESVAYIKRNDAVEVPCVSYNQSTQSSEPVTLYTSSGSTRPHGRAFSTPIIQPLKLNSSPEKSSVAALDEVLEDIRSSLRKKSGGPGTLERMSPRYSPMLSPSAVKPVQQVFTTPPVMTSSSVDISQKNIMPTNNIRPSEINNFSTNVPQSQRLTELQNQFNLSNQPPVQPSVQNQQTVLQAMQIIPDYTQEPYIINGNYQLDPNLLKEKLLSTGLAADGSDVESIHGRPIGRRSTTPTLGLYQTPHLTTVQNQQSDAESQVLKTVEELKNLAKDVEKRLSQIRNRMESSDENKLDSILHALRNFTPAEEPMVTVQMPTVQLSTEYSTKKTKLQEALSELDRIYDELDLQGQPVTTVTSEIKGNTIPRQYRGGSDTQIHIKSTTKKRNKSDSDFSDAGFGGITIADIERQTQKEFEDINLAFQSLLAEVDNPPKEEDEIEVIPEIYSKEFQSNADEIEATIESFLQEFGQTQSIGTKSSNFNKALDDYNAKKENENKCRDIQKSEVYTVSSGPFSVVVGLNGKQKKTGMSSGNSSRAIVRRKRPIPMPWKTHTTQSTGAQTTSAVPDNTLQDPEVKVADPEVKVADTSVEIKEKLSDKDVVNDDCSDSSEQSGGNRRFSKRGKRFNAHHRKSLPAEILKRSVETQTMEPALQAEAVKEKFQPKEFDRLREDSLSSESSIETRVPQKRKVAKNIAKKLEIFSSSEDERSRSTNLSHSHSAPDIRELFDFEKVTSKGSFQPFSKVKSPRLVKQRYDARVKRKTSLNSRETPADEKGEEVSWTSATSDDGSQVSHGSKPPLHPGKKQKSSSPDRILSDAKTGQSRKASSDAESNVESEVVRRRKKSNSQDESPERPHSFHELLTMFETDPDRLHKLKNSLRKCASADNVSVETVLRKSYHSEPDLREGSPFSSGAKLDLEIKLKV